MRRLLFAPQSRCQRPFLAFPPLKHLLVTAITMVCDSTRSRQTLQQGRL